MSTPEMAFDEQVVKSKKAKPNPQQSAPTPKVNVHLLKKIKRHGA